MNAYNSVADFFLFRNPVEWALNCYLSSITTQTIGEREFGSEVIHSNSFSHTLKLGCWYQNVISYYFLVRLAKIYIYIYILSFRKQTLGMGASLIS